MKQSVLDLQTQVTDVLADAVLTSVIALDELTIEVAPSRAIESFTK